MRQVAIDAASIPKDAKIAVLEKTSAESHLTAGSQHQISFSHGLKKLKTYVIINSLVTNAEWIFATNI